MRAGAIDVRRKVKYATFSCDWYPLYLTKEGEAKLVEAVTDASPAGSWSYGPTGFHCSRIPLDHAEELESRLGEIVTAHSTNPFRDEIERWRAGRRGS